MSLPQNVFVQAMAYRRRLDAESDDSEPEIQYGWTATEDGVSSYFVVFLSLLAIALIFSKFLHDRPGLQMYLPEAGMIIILGIAASFIIWVVAPDLLEDDGYDDHDDYFSGSYFNNDDGDDGGGDDGKERYAGFKGLLSFSSTFFFTVLLPPIIFNSGYHVNRLFFFRHLRPIILYACMGTFICICVMAGMLHLLISYNLTGGFKPKFSELLVFASLISSTDPVSTLAVFQKKQVDPQLFYLVFGESVLNDGVCLVLFNAFSKIVGHEAQNDSLWHTATTLLKDFLFSFSVSLLFGVFAGMAIGWIFKMVDMRNTRLLELSLYVLTMYLPFFAAEALDLSGIVTILFTGISARRYAEPNLSVTTQAESDVLFRVTSHLAETAIFLELGLSVFGLGLSSFDDFYLQFALWAVLVCLIGRACSIYPVTLFVNTITNSILRSEARKKQEILAETVDTEGSTLYMEMPNNNPNSSQDLVVSMNTAHMLWFSGLRGAVAYACAKTFPDEYGNQRTFIHITMFICLSTVFILGSQPLF